MQTINKSQYYNHMIFLANFIFAIMIVWGVSGESPRVHDIFLFWVLWNLLWLKPLVFKVFSPLLLIWIFYAPIGLQYGYPNTGMIASLFETTSQEVKEFWDIGMILLVVGVVCLTILMYVLNKKLVVSPKQTKFFRYISAIVLILFAVNMLSIKNFSIKWGYSELLGIVPNTLEYHRLYVESREKMQQLQQLQDNWQVTDFKPKYQNYVLVIGESASKNFLSAYGYPVKTSPFLEKINGTKYTQAISASAYTTQSVPRLLSIPNREAVEYQNNLILLANRLGMSTHWISNQDKLGVFENEIAYIAMNAQEEFYLSEEAPTTARYDYQMLPKIKALINQKTDKPKLIIVHLMGSHARFVKRVDFDKAHFNFKDKYLSHYLSSLLQTDMLLEEIYQNLQTAEQPFSMIYISDHALTPTKLKHGMTQFSLQVPLFKLSSDDTQQQTDDTIISGFSFVWFLTEWLGIDTKNQAENTFLPSYKMDKLADVKVFDNKTQDYVSLEEFDGELLKPEP